MPILIEAPARIEAVGTLPKLIHEYVGRVRSGTQGASLAVMESPAGWSEPAQKPEFDEFTLVLEGNVRLVHDEGTIDVAPGQAVIARAGERVQYSTPRGARYVSVCVPAFTPETVHRE